MIVRIENENDFEQIHAVNTLAFGKEEEAKLVELLRHSEAYIPQLALVAEKDSVVIGHILFTKIQIVEGKTAFESLALAPMAVLPEFQNKGIGSLLVSTGLQQAKEMGYSSVIVLGHEKYYPRFGFKKASKYEIRPPFDVKDEAFMALELQEGALNGITGCVRYSKSFGLPDVD